MMALELAEFSYLGFTPQSLSEIRKINPEIQKLFFKTTHSDAQLYTAIKNDEIIFSNSNIILSLFSILAKI